LTSLHNCYILYIWWFGVICDPSANSGFFEQTATKTVLSEERRDTGIRHSSNNVALSQDGIAHKSNTPLQRNVDALKIYRDSYQVDNCYEWEDDRIKQFNVSKLNREENRGIYYE